MSSTLVNAIKLSAFRDDVVADALRVLAGAVSTMPEAADFAAALHRFVLLQLDIAVARAAAGEEFDG
jgi:hypothetical protein